VQSRGLDLNNVASFASGRSIQLDQGNNYRRSCAASRHIEVLLLKNFLPPDKQRNHRTASRNVNAQVRRHVWREDLVTFSMSDYDATLSGVSTAEQYPAHLEALSETRVWWNKSPNRL